MSDGFDDEDIDWDAAFTQIEPSAAERVVAAVKDVLANSEGVPKLAIAYEGGEPVEPPTASDIEVAAGLGGAALDRPTTEIVDENGVLDEDKLLARLEAQPTSLFERFRRRTNRLSVSDLVSPSWCEQQYFCASASLYASSCRRRSRRQAQSQPEEPSGRHHHPA